MTRPIQIPLDVSEATIVDVNPGEEINIVLHTQLKYDASEQHIYFFKGGPIARSTDWRKNPTITLDNSVILDSIYDKPKNRRKLNSKYNVCESFSDRYGYYLKTQLWCDSLLNHKAYRVDAGEPWMHDDDIKPDVKPLAFSINAPSQKGTYRYSFYDMQYSFPDNKWHDHNSERVSPVTDVIVEVGPVTPPPPPPPPPPDEGLNILMVLILLLGVYYLTHDFESR